MFTSHNRLPAGCRPPESRNLLPFIRAEHGSPGNRNCSAKILQYGGKLDWRDKDALGIDRDAWNYVTRKLQSDPKLAFCHPDILLHDASLSLYYRGISILSLKAVREYAGSVEQQESGQGRHFAKAKAETLSATYNRFISAVINGVDDWMPQDGHRALQPVHLRRHKRR